jgi:hypothetical protein
LAEEQSGIEHPVAESFLRKVVNVRKVFRDALDRHLVDGRIDDKEKLEQDKLKISASLLNFVVAGGVLLFPGEAKEPSAVSGTAAGKTGSGSEEIEHPGQGEAVMDEASLFRLLRMTILVMLNELNKPDVNLLKISLSKNFREKLQSVFSKISSEDPDQFPVKIFHDLHPGKDSYIGINMRNTRSLGDDIDRIERNLSLKKEIIERLRPIRHTDGNLYKLFASPLSSPKGSQP